MDCQEAKTGLSPYLDGELARDDAAGIASHLNGCDECRRSFEELRLVGTLIRTQLAVPDTRPWIWLAKVMAAIANLPADALPATRRPAQATHVAPTARHVAGSR